MCVRVRACVRARACVCYYLFKLFIIIIKYLLDIRYFLRYVFACELSFTFCDFDIEAFWIISTAVTHQMLMLIS